MHPETGGTLLGPVGLVRKRAFALQLEGVVLLLFPLRMGSWEDPVQVLQPPWMVPVSVTDHLS